MFRDWRCGCGRLLFRVGIYSLGEIEAKCARCKLEQIVELNPNMAGSS